MLLAVPLRAVAEDLPAGHYQVGADVQGGLVGHQGTLLLNGLVTYTVHDWIAVGIQGGHSLAGVPAWRAGALAQVFIGPEFLRPYVQLRLEALSLQNTPAVFGLGFDFGLAYQPHDRIAIVPTIGFDATLRVNGAVIGEVGVAFQYVFW
jgi:hypothetical protein